jgi:hypothetical protein
MLSFEAKYRQEAMEVPARASFGLLKIWIGRFYLGFWGVVALIFGVLGSGVWFWQVLFVDPNRTNNPLLNFIRGQIYPPPPEVGLSITFDGSKGFWWLFVVFCATVTFFAWMMRQIDIARLLKMGYQVPIAFGAVLSSWVTIQILRPILLGQLVGGLPAGCDPTLGLAFGLWLSLLQLLLQPLPRHWHHPAVRQRVRALPPRGDHPQRSAQEERRGHRGEHQPLLLGLLGLQHWRGRHPPPGLLGGCAFGADEQPVLRALRDGGAGLERVLELLGLRAVVEGLRI